MSKPKSEAARLLVANEPYDVSRLFAEMRSVIAKKLKPHGWTEPGLENQLTMYRRSPDLIGVKRGKADEVIGMPAVKAADVFEAIQFAEIDGGQWSAANVVLRYWEFVESVSHSDTTNGASWYAAAKKLYWHEREHPGTKSEGTERKITARTAVGKKFQERHNKRRISKKGETEIGATRMRELLEAEKYHLPNSFENMWPTARKRIHFELYRELI